MNWPRATTCAALIAMASVFAVSPAQSETPLPDGFVHLRTVAPDILQDMRYAGTHNFVGRPIEGYDAAECILSRSAAEALARAQVEFLARGLTIQVFDCYRPARAVGDFVQWAEALDDVAMKAEFYPRVDKSELFDRGYIAFKSGHSRGSTVDLTLRPVSASTLPQWSTDGPLVDCVAPDRYQDGSLDFGTGYDCFDIKAHHGAAGISPEATRNREVLASVLGEHGFAPYQEEWWHYTLKDEPFAETYFEFPISKASD